MLVLEKFAVILRSPEGEIMRDDNFEPITVEGERWIEMPTVTEEVQAAVDAQTAAVQAAESGNETSLRGQADQALVNLRAYRDLASPTNAQTVAAVKLLCRVCIALIRLVLRKLDAAD